MTPEHEKADQPPRMNIAWSDIPQAVFDEARDRLWTYTATVFGADGPRAHYLGTATFVRARGVPSILTAAHVWDALPGDQFALSLEPDRDLLIIKKSIVRATVLRGGSTEWGPDIALLAIPDPLLASRISVDKAFYDLDRRREAALTEQPRYDDGMWGVLGAPAEHSVLGENEATLRMGLFATSDPRPAERDGFDYVDIPINRAKRPHLPSS